MTFKISPVPPTGKFTVGVTSYQLVDLSRKEMFSDDATQRRELALQIWYPAMPVAGANSICGTSAFPWGSLICPPKSMKESEFHQFFERITQLVQAQAVLLEWPKLAGEVQAHAFPHAPLMKENSPYPVVLFSHGNGGYVAQTTYLMEELASHGYAVISIGHTYNGWLTVFPDGRIIPANFDHPIYKTIDEEVLKTRPLLDDIKKSNSSAYRQARYQEVYKERPWPTYFKSLQYRVDDLKFVIDELHRLDNDPNWILAGVLDLSRLGVLGYSLGGETASQLCVTEQRVKVGVALDSDLWGNMFGQSVRQPFYSIYAESHEVRDTEPDNRNPAVIVGGTKHASFGSNSYWWESQGKLDVKGSLATARCHEIVRRYVLAFFNHHFQNLTDSILKRESVTMPEVRYLVSPLV